MAHSASIPRYRRWLAGILAVLLGLGPLATPAYAAPTALADQPLNAQNLAKPNIVMTVDDSTSMLFDFLPDTVIGRYCRDMTGSMNANCGTPGQNTVGRYVTPGYIFEQYGMPFRANNPAFDVSGPGSGCAGANCSPGIDPAPTPVVLAPSMLYPGIERYPAGTSPKAGQPYEYWTLWPAPAHNSELNHIYYNPRQQYDPPVKADGTPYPQMNDWTRVPADPWAATVQYVDLTAPVTVGLWCNSDWSVGHENDPSYCRTNGTGANAATSSTSSADGDYNYPWAPPGIDLAASSTIAKSIAFSKVDAANNNALKPAWTAAQDPKYFYENDNILWCDATSPLWPHQGPKTDQACIGGSSTPQSCINRKDQTCAGTPQTCGALTPQTCNGITDQTCVHPLAQTCDGIGNQTCAGISSQTCSGATPTACNLVAPTCIPPSPDTCTTVWQVNGVPVGPDVCPCTGNECPACTPITTCPPGKCSSNNADCQDASTCPSTGTCSANPSLTCGGSGDCPTLPRHCSIDTAAQCSDSIPCTNVGHCDLVGNVCHGSNPAECPPQAGHCTNDRFSCFDDISCVRSGHCSTSNAACTIGTECQPVGTCSISTTACTAASGCPSVGRCSASNAACTIDRDCPDLDAKCSVTGQACSPTPYFPICQPDFVTTCAEPSFCPIQGGECSVTHEPCLPSDWSIDPPPPHDIAYCNPVFTAGHCSVDTDTVCFGDDGRCGPTNGPSASATCSDLLNQPTQKSLLEDANTLGVVCRHNNRAGGYSSGPYSYPDAKYNTPVTAGTGASACVASPRYATVPRHYWKTGLEWCNKAVATAGDKWLGYGTPSGGSCQSSQDTTRMYIYPRFYQFGQAPGTDNYATPAFRRMDLVPGTMYTHDWTDEGGPEHISRTYAEEITNYANWFAYYRTRIQAVKTVTSASFAELDAKFRVGFHAMFSLSSFLNVGDFDAAQKPAWFSKLFGVTIPLGQETPTLTALARIGDYFQNGGHPQLSGSTDPIVLSCQQNFHMLFTDGFTNQSSLPTTTVGNVDGDAVPSTANLIANPVIGLTPGQPWPHPFREDTLAGASNALSDYALHYWVTDLRPGMADNVPVSSNPPLATDRYSAKWQHLNFAALSLGTSGKLPTGQQALTEGDLRSGALEWPQPYPNVLQPDNSGVDDLWHAAMNGHGDFVNADSIDEVKLGIGKILAGVGNLPGTRTSVGFVSNTFGASANFIYRVRFEQDWSGSVAKIQIDPTTGAALDQPPIWNASDQLKAVLTPTVAKPAPWFTERRIVTMNQAGAKVPFVWSSLGANQKDSLAPGKPLKGQAVLEFLRGNQTKEGEKVGQFRVRASPLGDIVDSSPVYIGAPGLPYLDASDPGYSGFKSTFAARAPRLYVGANDGMLHVFDEATGNETWAYVPTPLFRGGSATALPPVPNDPKTGLGALAYQDGALPAFRHHYYVDLTPKIIDVDFNAPNGDQWRTLLVGGLGKGGNRYFALDVTDPSAVTTEAAAANQVLWEFPPVGDTAIDMGYTYGKPIIAKTRALFNGAWVVMVGSGYNNPSGAGKLYFLQASDPTHYKMMSTGAGSAGSPAGLAHPAGYTQDFHNQLAEQIYAGDLLGNFWRFDVSDAGSDSAWTVGQYAKLTADNGSVQPVTTPPEIKIDVSNGIDRWVFVGTGKLYDESDLADSQLQTMYALRDGTASAPWVLPATPVDRTTAGMVALPATDSTNKFGLANIPDKGWFHDLPAGSRIVVAPQAAFGVIAYIATEPQTDPCLTGSPVKVYAREYGTGQSVLTENADGSGNLVPFLQAEGGVGLQIVSFQSADGGAPSAPDIRLAITMPDGTVRYFKPKLPQSFFQHRMSWRLLGQ